MIEQPNSVHGSGDQEGDPEEGTVVLRLGECEVPREECSWPLEGNRECKDPRRELAQIAQGTERKADVWITVHLGKRGRSRGQRSSCSKE